MKPLGSDSYDTDLLDMCGCGNACWSECEYYLRTVDEGRGEVEGEGERGNDEL